MIPVHHITTMHGVYSMREYLRKQTVIGFDTENTGLDPITVTPLLASFATKEIAYVIDFTVLNPAKVYSELKDILTDTNIIKVGHNLAYDWRCVYTQSRIEMNGLYDTMIGERIVKAGLNERFDLKTVVRNRLDIDLDKSVREGFIDWQGESFTEQQIRYSGEDSVYPIIVMEQQLSEMGRNGLLRIKDLEMDIIAPSAFMEQTGIPIDSNMLYEMIPVFEKYIESADQALQDIIIEFGGAEKILFENGKYTALNTRSNKQVLEAFHRMGINVKSLNSKDVKQWDTRNSQSKRNSKKYNFEYEDVVEDSDVAEALDLYAALNHKVLRAYAFLVAMRKLHSTYVIGMINAIHPKTQRIHPHFNSLGAHRTGRYSSTDINAQNIPSDEKLKRLNIGDYSIRRAIRPIKKKGKKDRKIIVADFAGIELVILATLSNDKKLLSQITEGDVHTFVCHEVLHYMDINKKNKKEYPHVMYRQSSKKLSYSIAYGVTSKNVSETMSTDLATLGVKVSQDQAQEHIDTWFNTFPDTKAYLQSNAEHAIMYGYVTDCWGRRRHWDRSTFIDKWKRLAASREGMNAPIQGTSATMTKQAIRLLWSRLDRSRARLIMTVHDELVLESTEEYAEESARIVKECMEQAIRDTLPTIADIVGLYEGTSVSPSISDCYDK